MDLTILSGESRFSVFSVGHSTRSLDEFIALLESCGVEMIVDVRFVPRSRHNPQFNKETLCDSLKIAGIRYIHIPGLGGLRRPSQKSINLALEHKSFRGYADYMQTKEFAESLLHLVALIHENCVAIMCAEAVPWRCHRTLVADALATRHIIVKHILNETCTIKHELTPFAHVEGTKISYPLFTKEKTQRNLLDFGGLV